MAVTRRVLRGVRADVEWENVDQEGATAAAAGAVTVGVTRADGTTVLAAGTATTTPGVGRYVAALTAGHTAELDLLTFRWADAGDDSTHTSEVEVAGGYFFTVAEVRGAFNEITVARHSDERVQRVRQIVEEEAEAICGVAFVPRFATVRLDGDGTSSLLLPHLMVRRIRAVRFHDGANVTALDADELTALAAGESGEVVRAAGVFPRGVRNVAVDYEHGYDEPPRELAEKAMLRLADLIAAPRSQVGNRATTYTSEAGGGTYRLDTAKRRRTGMPEVDATYERHSLLTPGL